MSNTGQNRRVAAASKNTAYYPAPFSTGAILTLFKQIAIFSSLPLWLPHRKIFEPNHRPTLLPGGAVLAASSHQTSWCHNYKYALSQQTVSCKVRRASWRESTYSRPRYSFVWSLKCRSCATRKGADFTCNCLICLHMHPNSK